MRLVYLVLLILLVLTIAACASKPPYAVPPADPVTVKIAVPIPCVDKLPEHPKIFTDAELLAMTEYNFVTALHIDRYMLMSHTARLEAILLGCMEVQETPKTR